MPNEVTIHVTMADDTAAGREAVKAAWAETAATIQPLKVTATNPIDDAWQAQVDAGLAAAGSEPLDITVTANTDELQASVEEVFAALRADAAEPLAIGPADTEAFQVSALEAVAVVRAEIAAAMAPIEMPSVYANATRLDRLVGEQPQLALPPGVGSVSPGVDPFSFRSSYTPGPMFGPGGDPYAQARQTIADNSPIEMPIRAANPIDDAWIAQVKSSIRGVANDALKIPVNAELEGFQAQLEDVLAELAATSKLDIPVDVGDAMIFREQVQELVAQVEMTTKAVIDIQVNEGALSELQQKTMGAAQASLDLVSAEQKLNEAMASGDEDKIAKARGDVVAATKEERAAVDELKVAQAAAGQEATGLAAAEDVAAESARGFGAAMGPLWMLMNVAQLAMFAFGSSSSSTATQVQDASQQIIQLGQAAGTAATGLVAGNQNMQGFARDLELLGTNSTQFAQQYSGSIDAAAAYTKKLEDQQTSLGNTMVTVGVKTAQSGKAGGEAAEAQSMSIEQVAKSVAGNADAYNKLDSTTQGLVDQYNALNDIVPQAKNALEGMRAAAEANKETLAGLGFVMTDGQNKSQQYGLGIQAAAKALQDAVSGSTYLEDATDKASIAAGQGAQQWAQLQAAVASAGQQVESASHSVITAEQGVESARHSQAQATLAVTAAQQGYSNALYQQKQAQDAVTASEAAAEQQMISLKLQAADAAASAQSSNLSLYRATQAAAKVGVDAGNEQAFASLAPDQINATNEAQVAAADALIQAQNQVADAANSSATAQSSLNTARQQGVANNPAVLSAEHALDQANQAVQTSADGVANAQWAQQQAAIAVGNAQWGVVSAEQGLATAEANLTTAKDASSRSTDQNTLIGAQNRQMIENLFTAYENMTGNEQTAAQMTQTAAEKMGFMSNQVDDVIGAVEGLNGQSATFSIIGTPSLNPQQLTQIGNELGMSFSQIENALPGPGQQGYHSAGRAQATGGPGGGLTWVGEGGPELVDLPHGTEVITNANSMMMVASGEVLPPGHAVGGPVGADAVLAANLPLAAQWGAMDTVGQVLHALGGPAVSLPPAGNVDWGAFGGMPGSVPGGHAAVSGLAAEAQAYAASQLARYGWGGDQMPPLISLWDQESGWNPYAVNPSSGAYGIPQSLGHGHPYDLGDYVAQVNWGLNYIAGRYGSPMAAEAHERAVHWYGGGGPASGVVGVGDRGPELVRLPGAAGAAQSLQVELSINFSGNTDGAFATAFHRLVRENKVQLSANVNGKPARVKAGA